MSRRAKSATAGDTERDMPLSIMLPAGIVRAVKVRPAERDETLRQTVLRALEVDGFRVPGREIIARRAPANKRRGRA